MLWWQFPKYRNNTNTGFYDNTGLWEAHHILCNHSVEGRQIDDDSKSFVEACLWITEWNLNDAHNMIGLPKNRQYINTLGTKPVNLPSHQIGHNTAKGYTNEVTTYLKDKIWDTLNDKREAHKINAQAIKEELKSGSDHFRKLLGKRGERKKGTLHCWQHRFPTPPPTISSASYVQEEKWYYPFSMAKKPSERHPGIDYELLKKIFRKM